MNLIRILIVHIVVISALAGCTRSINSSTSSYETAERYRIGNGKLQSPPLAFDNYQLDAKQGNPKSLCRLSWCYQVGFGTERNLSQAFDTLNNARDTGDGQLLRMLANMYSLGIGCEQDYSESLRLYTLSYEAGDLESLVCIANQYRLGQGVDRDEVQATKLLEDAMKTGNQYAKMQTLSEQLMRLINNKHRTTEDNQKLDDIADILYKLGENDSYLILHFPMQYILSYGIHSNYQLNDFLKKHIVTFKTLLHSKVPECFSIADYFVKGDELFNIKLEGAKSGLPDCMEYVGNCYLDGENVLVDLRQAKRWLEEASKRNVPSATCKLGWMYHVGKIGVVNYQQAVKYYIRAIEQGDVNANYFLGFCYQYGQGLPRNRQKAIACYRAAANKGNLQSRQALSHLGVK